MFLVISLPEGNTPVVRTFDDEGKAERYFLRVKLDKWTGEVHLFNGEKPMESRYMSDGERYSVKH